MFHPGTSRPCQTSVAHSIGLLRLGVPDRELSEHSQPYLKLSSCVMVPHELCTEVLKQKKQKWCPNHHYYKVLKPSYCHPGGGACCQSCWLGRSLGALLALLRIWNINRKDWNIKHMGTTLLPQILNHNIFSKRSVEIKILQGWNQTRLSLCLYLAVFSSSLCHPWQSNRAHSSPLPSPQMGQSPEIPWA